MCRLDTALHIFITVTDSPMVHFGPLYVALGLALILAVSYTYLALIYRQLYAERGPVHAALHLSFGLALLYNILLNYWLCVATPPGSTAAMKEVHITATTCTVLSMQAQPDAADIPAGDGSARGACHVPHGCCMISGSGRLKLSGQDLRMHAGLSHGSWQQHALLQALPAGRRHWLTTAGCASAACCAWTTTAPGEPCSSLLLHPNLLCAGPCAQKCEQAAQQASAVSAASPYISSCIGQVLRAGSSLHRPLQLPSLRSVRPVPVSGRRLAACSAWGRMSMRETSAQDMGWLIIVFALSASTAFALVILFAWHAYLICSAQVRSTLMVAATIHSQTQLSWVPGH